MHVQEFMTTRIEFIDSERTVYDAIEKMVDRRIRSLVVRFPGTDKNHGVITARDIVFKVFAKGADPSETKVASIASKPIVCIEPDMTMGEVATMMERSHIARVFICKNEEIIGVLSLLDLMAASLIIRARGDHVP